jgi:hypothetical protein
MSDNTHLSGTAAKQLADARQCNGRKGIDLLFNRNFSARAICDAVMDHSNVIERTAPELIKLYRQLGCWPAHGLGVGGSRRDDDTSLPSCAGYRFPAEVISHAVWLVFHFPLSRG